MKLSLDALQVETFSTADDWAAEPASTSSMAPTYYGCSCGCGTAVDCPSDGPRCTDACVEPSNATDWQACCG
ncbi:MAG TPA: hypothetical protein VHG08_16200 [Longimicrobium sp.]|nr:hypothetical protein [Longimicrobium sp.]